MSISFVTLTKIYKNREEKDVGIAICDSSDFKEIFYPLDPENIPEGLDILEYIVNQVYLNLEDLEFDDEELRYLLDNISFRSIVFIDGDKYEWSEIKDILALMHDDKEDEDKEDEEDD